MEQSPARPAVSLGLTFLFVAFSFALPVALIPASQSAGWTGQLPAEAANVYACAAWAGWAHFIYAFRGQAMAMRRLESDGGWARLGAFAVAVVLVLGVLLLARRYLGISLFGAIVWVYFIDHYLKAEQSFSAAKGAKPLSFLHRWLSTYQPALAFGWLSAVLLNVAGVDSHLWVLMSISLVLAAQALWFRGWNNLSQNKPQGTLLALFFIAEALVWGAFSRYGGQVFLTGVYVFHVAAGSYVHYLGSYFAGQQRSAGNDKWLLPIGILGINAVIIGLGWASANYGSLKWLLPVLGVPWFTLWVGLHLVASDLFPWFKRLPLKVNR